MKLCAAILILFALLLGCSEDNSNLPQITVEFDWIENQICFDNRSPQILLDKVPIEAKSLEINLFDLDSRYDHGGGTVAFEGSSTIPQGSLREYNGPCPNYGSPRYQLTVKAKDKDGKVIAIGKQIKRFPP